MIERISCYWCNNYATHDAQASGDRTVPACNKCDKPETMRDWNWTPLARGIGLVIEAVAVIGFVWLLMSAGWFMLGGGQ